VKKKRIAVIFTGLICLAGYMNLCMSAINGASTDTKSQQPSKLKTHSHLTSPLSGKLSTESSFISSKLSSFGNDRHKVDQPPAQPRAWREFLYSKGDSAYLNSLDATEFAHCSDCIFTLSNAVLSGDLPNDAAISIAKFLVYSGSAEAGAVVARLARAWQNQPIEGEIAELALKAIDRYATTNNGIRYLAEIAIHDGLIDAHSLRLRELLEKRPTEAQNFLLEPTWSDTDAATLASLAPLPSLAEAFILSTGSRKSVLAKALAQDLRPDSLLTIFSIADQLTPVEAKDLGFTFGLAQLYGDRAIQLETLIQKSTLSDRQITIANSMLQGLTSITENK